LKKFAEANSRITTEVVAAFSLDFEMVRIGLLVLICYILLNSFFGHASCSSTKIPASLLDDRHLDLAEVSGLTVQTKQKICVSGRCGNDCPYINNCRYLQFRDNNQSDKYAFQICNHNYLLADIVKCSKKQSPLIPNYQTLIIDEAHKFLHSAQQIYGIGLSNDIIPSITNEIYNSAVKQTNENQEIRTITKKLYDQNRRLFNLFNKNLEAESDDEETERYTVEVSDQVLRHFKNICNISTAIIELLANKPKFGKSKGIRLKILHNLAELGEQSDILRKYNNLIGWLEKNDENTTFFAIPKNLSNILYNNIWSKRIPMILTSETLAANGDFTHIKRTLGLAGAKNIAETVKPTAA
jgi:ATP-dependent DNA helicase DinG